MNVKIKRGDKVIAQSNSCDFIINPNTQRKKLEDSMKNSTLKVNLRKNGEIYNPASKQEDNIPRVSYFGSDAKETMNNIMAQIKQNTREEQVKKPEAVQIEEPKVEIPVVEEAKEKTPIPEETVVNEEPEESADPVTIKVPDKVQVDDKGRRIIGRTPRFIPDEVESEY